ncbi:DEAD/DEAH box helicase [Alicyclobacillus acidocaldarius]|uniref:Type III restriction protein res subunit n=1 Tax=Alicyclobacillus acidocaldarius subsp. acidocaldarius (strain ATCC 27009 / DSM 446 / BCRC 14685 / JCM 5260 / KCTC 1825 / NBRC 15652 / NCIMB 11725 / NRRL B-14509 / 104-IA) TaxID=521098 RepID=C8WVJ5_ALIAD|nr:DEAD/DEAH box helicase [Alicyclobacillus acidocaldarius]ACV58117.1 type III restriction protein res subunit [Alicyclobacillus acidocaldarius subsp. acidocaldarius DSM 446]
MQFIVAKHQNNLKLRDYQVEAVDAIRRYPKPRPVLVAATGAGKTVISSQFAVERLERGPVLFLAHRDELLDQTLDKFSVVFDALAEKGREVKIGRIQGPDDDVEADFAVASVQTISQPERLERWMAAHETTPTVITDECHHATARTYMRIYHALGFLGSVPEGHVHLGLTATPYRTDKADLRKVYDGVAYAIGIHDLIDMGWLVPPKSVKLEIVEGLEGKDDGADWSDAEVEGAVDTPSVNKQIVAAWQAQASDRLTIAFCASVEHAYHLAEEFEKAGVPVAVVHGALPKEERRQTLDAFSDGNIRVLCNYGVLTEGFDRPEVSCIIMARPTLSHSLYVQCVGRGLRIAPHIFKQDCLVLDVVGVTDVHRLMTVDRLLAGEDKEESGEKREGPGVKRGPRIAKRLTASAFRWARVRERVWLARDFKGNYVRVEQTQVGWHVAYGRFSTDELSEKPEMHRVYFGPDAEMAWGTAATYAQIGLARSAVGAEEEWMALPPTEKQVAALRRRGLAVPQTRWEAAELLTQPTPRQEELLKKIFRANNIPHALLPETMDEANALLNAVLGQRLGRQAFLVRYSMVLPHRWEIFRDVVQRHEEAKAAAEAIGIV